jgi:hypothetical protein
MIKIRSGSIVATGSTIGRGLLTLTLLAVLSGCLALQVKNIWEDEAYRGGRPQKVLVLCAMNVPTVKRAFENEFVKNLKDHGITAVESFRIVPETAFSESGARDALVALIREQGFDTLLYTRAIKGRSEVSTIPGMTIVKGTPYPFGGGGGVGFVVGGDSRPTTQSYTHEQDYLSIDTVLFDVRTEGRLWASESELRVSGQSQEHIKPYVAMITDKLTKSRIFK